MQIIYDQFNPKWVISAIKLIQVSRFSNIHHKTKAKLRRIFAQLKKLISISLTLILLFGSVGITYGAHSCGGVVVLGQMMIGQEHLDCGMNMATSGDVGANLSAADCCQNEYISLDTKDLLEKSLVHVLSDVFISTTVASILYAIDLDFSNNQDHVVDISQPFPDPDILVLYQVFRI